METSSRGFKYGESTLTDRQEEVRVYESSSALSPHIWLKVSIPADSTYGNDEEQVAHAHLSLEQAKQVRDQLDYLIQNHYQVEDEMEMEPGLRGTNSFIEGDFA